MKTTVKCGLIIGGLAALTLTGASLSPANAQGRHEIHQDRQDIRHDQRDIREDVMRLQQLERLHRHEVLAGHRERAKRLAVQITRLHAKLQHDRHDIPRDRRDIYPGQHR